MFWTGLVQTQMHSVVTKEVQIWDCVIFFHTFFGVFLTLNTIFGVQSPGFIGSKHESRVFTMPYLDVFHNHIAGLVIL